MIDADPASPTYGRLVTTVSTDQKTMQIHHTEYVMPASGKPVASRIGIVFMFSQTCDPPRNAAMHKYDEPLTKATDRSALHMATIEPQNPAPSGEDGSVILNVRVAAAGKLSSVQKLSGD